jgi:hypothetical protein
MCRNEPIRKRALPIRADRQNLLFFFEDNVECSAKIRPDVAKCAVKTAQNEPIMPSATLHITKRFILRNAGLSRGAGKTVKTNPTAIIQGR